MSKNSKMDTAKLISDDDLETMLKHLEKKCVSSKVSLRNYAILLLLADAGCRVGEVVALEMTDILQASELVLALRIRSEIAKYGIERIIPMSKRLSGSLHQYIRAFPTLLNEKNFFLFPGARSLSSHLSVRQVEYLLRKLSHTCLGRVITPHALRHSFATRLIKTTPLPVVQELLGHKNLSSTQVYVHPTTKDLFDAIDKL